MASYVDMLMRNHKLVSDSSFESPGDYTTISYKKSKNKKRKQTGGTNEKIKNTATGSYPPIYKLSKDEKEKKEQDKKRGFSAPRNKSAVSIKEIMEERREEKTPFLEL